MGTGLAMLHPPIPRKSMRQRRKHQVLEVSIILQGLNFHIKKIFLENHDNILEQSVLITVYKMTVFNSYNILAHSCTALPHCGLPIILISGWMNQSVVDCFNHCYSLLLE